MELKGRRGKEKAEGKIKGEEKERKQTDHCGVGGLIAITGGFNILG